MKNEEKVAESVNLTRFRFAIDPNLEEHYLPFEPSTPGSSGIDIRSRSRSTIHLPPFESEMVWSGLWAEVDPGFEIQIRPRSGLALRKGITVLNTPATIDADYRGEIGALLYNSSRTVQEVVFGERIAQLVVCRVETPRLEMTRVSSRYELSSTLRGENGFGSTGSD